MKRMSGTMTSARVWTDIGEVVTQLLAERGEEPGSMTADTNIGADLGISSVDAIHMMIMLEDRLATELNFQELAVRDGEYVQDISLGELRAFLCRSVGVPDAG
jgi:acyl carrier protein